MFWLPIAAALAGTAINAYGQNRAAKEQQRILAEGRARTQAIQNQATNAAMQRAGEFDAAKRAGKEQEIATQQTQLFEQASKPIDAQGVEIGRTVEGTPDYQAAKAKQAVATAQSMRELASIMGRLGAAGQLRQQEAIDIGDTANQIGQLGRHADIVGGIYQQQAQDTQAKPAYSILGGALQGYGMGGLSGGASGIGGTNDMSTLAKISGKSPLDWWRTRGYGGD
jgi:hypothetical protein